MTPLEQYRTQISKLDGDIIRLLAERFELVQKVGKYKIENDLSTFQEGQWKKVLDRVVKSGEMLQISQECIESIWSAIHKESLIIQYRQKGMYTDISIKPEE